MGATFSIKFTVSTEQDQLKFKQAYAQIYALVKALVTSKNKHIQSYIADPLESDETWVWLDEENDLRFMAEHHVSICSSDADGKIPKAIHYDFGKALPTPVEFIGTIMSIIAHYFPKAKISHDAVDYIDKFSQGVYLANAISTIKVTNPLINKSNNAIPKVSNNINRILQALKSNVEAVETKYQPKDSGDLKNIKNSSASSKKRKKKEFSDEGSERLNNSFFSINKKISNKGGIKRSRLNEAGKFAEPNIGNYEKPSCNGTEEANKYPNSSNTVVKK